MLSGAGLPTVAEIPSEVTICLKENILHFIIRSLVLPCDRATYLRGLQEIFAAGSPVGADAAAQAF
jgi:hypothetical protein